MRAAMLLVTGAALVLAAVGFAATTAALGRTRRRENAVLLALGMPPGRIRRVLALERVGVVVLTVAVGLGARGAEPPSPSCRCSSGATATRRCPGCW